jgi:4-cresol dehydrogenase (hydroxylating)
MPLTEALAAWRAVLGPEGVLDGPAAEQEYGQDTGGARRRLAGALRIQHGDCLPEVVRIAGRHGVPLYPISTGRNWGYGTALPVVDDCVIVDLSGMNRILHFDAELGVVTVEPGVTQGMLADFLDAEGHPYMVPTTGAGPTCSLVGNALERGYGITPHADHFGAVTDIEAVLPDGTVYRTLLREVGGDELARLFKWGLGPYTAGLFTQGNAGIVTRMSIVLARRPECIQVGLFGLRDDALLEAGVQKIREILVALPGIVGGINLMNRHRVLAMTAPYPRERLGPDGLIPAAVLEEMGRQYQVLPWMGVITLFGTKRVVQAARREIRRILAGVGSRLVFLDRQQARAMARLATLLPGRIGGRLARTASTLAQSLELIGGRPNETALPLAYWKHPVDVQGRPRDPGRDGCGLIWYAPLVPARPANVRAVCSLIHDVTAAHGLEPLITLTSLSDRLFDCTVPLLFQRDDAHARQALACYQQLVDKGQAPEHGGCFPYRLGISAMHKVLDQAPMRGYPPPEGTPWAALSPGRYVQDRPPPTLQP